MSMNLDQKVEASTLSHINTQVVYPIAINQQSATIIIPNRAGSLDKHSAILLPATVQHSDSFYPIGTGVAALLDSITLLANGKVIAQNTDPGKYITMSNSFQQQEYRRRVLLPRTGCREDYGPSEAGVQNLGAAAPLTAPGKIGLKNTIYNNVTPQTATSTAGLDSFGDPNVAGVGNNNYRLATTKEQTSQFYLYLEQLFPKLYGSLQLPIHLIDSEVSLVIRFSSNASTFEANDRVLGSSSRVITAFNAAGARGVEVNCQIVTEEVVLLTDYLVPTQEAGNQLAAQVMSDAGYQLNYGDLLFNDFFVPGLPTVAATRNFTRYNFKMGASNQVIRQLYLMFNPTQNVRPTGKSTPYIGDATAGGEISYGLYDAINPLKGKYASKALSYLPDGERIQVNFNSQNIFNTPLQGAGQKIHELQIAYGSSFCQPSSTYDFSDITLDGIDALRPNYVGNEGRLLYQKSLMSRTHSAQGWSSQNLCGSNHYVGINLQRPLLNQNNTLVRANIVGSGQRCGPTPISFQIDRLCNRDEPNDNRNMTVCSVVEKSMVIRQGLVFIDNE